MHGFLCDVAEHLYVHFGWQSEAIILYMYIYTHQLIKSNPAVTWKGFKYTYIQFVRSIDRSILIYLMAGTCRPHDHKPVQNQRSMTTNKKSTTENENKTKYLIVLSMHLGLNQTGFNSFLP